MNIIKLIAFILTFHYIIALAQGGKNTIFGKYQRCNYYCTNVEIKSDSTFELRFYGDLFTGEGCSGKIKKDSNNIYIANSTKQPSKPSPVETFSNGTKLLTINLIDEHSNPVKGSPVFINYNDTSIIKITPDNGILEFPLKYPTRISAITPGGKIEYEIYSESLTDSIVFRCQNTLGYVFVTNEKWKIKGNMLWMYIYRSDNFVLVKQ